MRYFKPLKERSPKMDKPTPIRQTISPYLCRVSVKKVGEDPNRFVGRIMYEASVVAFSEEKLTRKEALKAGEDLLAKMKIAHDEEIAKMIGGPNAS